MKIALITGANRGVGKSIALESSKRGVGIVITYRTHADEADQVVSEIKKNGGSASALKLDVAKVSSFDSFLDNFKKILQDQFKQKTFDFLVNNAGTAQRSLIQDTTETIFDEMVNIHFKGPFFLTQKLLHLINEGGQIINISSGLTRFCHPGVATYASVKGAIEVFTNYLAKELGEKKIRANVVAPGALATDFGGGKNDESQKAIAQVTALGRVGNAEDIGLLIAGLFSEDSRWVNAQRIEASGGMYL